MHTIEESNELSQNEFNILNSEIVNSESPHILIQDETYNQNVYDEADSLLREVRLLFLQAESQETCDQEILNCQLELQDGCDEFSVPDLSNKKHNLTTTACQSPSFSLIQQFENAAKEEAALVLQSWFKRIRERRKFLKLRQSAIIIQRTFRSRQMGVR